MCTPGLSGVNACSALYDISVAFPHSRMDEVVFVHLPTSSHQVKPGSCWRLRRALNVTRKAIRDHVNVVDFGTAVVSENFESIIGPSKCGYVKLLKKITEYKPDVSQWHTDVKHARAVLQFQLLGASSVGGQLRNAEDELDNEDRRRNTAAQQARISITH